MPRFSATNGFASLGLSKTATETEVKKAYRKLALLHHPDKAGPDGEDRMKEINTAYELIMDDKLCGKYTEESIPKKASSTRPASAREPREARNADICGRLHSRIASFIKEEVDLPSFMQRHRQSSAQKDSNYLHDLLYSIRDLEDVETAEYEACFNLGVLLNLAKRILVSDEGTLNTANELFDELDYSEMLQRARIAEMLLRNDNTDIGDDGLGNPTFRTWVLEGWQYISPGWTAESVWNTAQKEWADTIRMY